MPKSKPAGNITLTGGGKTGRRRRSNRIPVSAANLRAWRIKLIQSAWRRVVARMETDQ